MAFHLRYMDEPIQDGSANFNFYRWNADGRKNAAQHVKTDTRVQPKPEQDINLDPQIRIMGKAGSILLFSAAQLHLTVPNTSGATRSSIDFRTVHLGDVKAKGGAKNLASHCTGTSLRDFVRSSDIEQMPEEVWPSTTMGWPATASPRSRRMSTRCRTARQRDPFHPT